MIIKLNKSILIKYRIPSKINPEFMNVIDSAIADSPVVDFDYLFDNRLTKVLNFTCRALAFEIARINYQKSELPKECLLYQMLFHLGAPE